MTGAVEYVVYAVYGYGPYGVQDGGQGCGLWTVLDGRFYGNRQRTLYCLLRQGGGHQFGLYYVSCAAGILIGGSDIFLIAVLALFGQILYDVIRLMG